MKTFLMIVIFVAALAGAGAVFVWFGFFDISARVPHWDATSEVIELLRDRSIIVHSRGVETPSLDAPGLVSKGAGFYHETCRHCHAAPGIPASPFSQGLYPAPADLLGGSVQNEWKGRGLYWIVDNGIKLTGMPAFGSTYEKEEIAAITAFLLRLPGMSPGEYRQMAGAGQDQM